MNKEESSVTHTLNDVASQPIIYFAGSIRAGREDVVIYASLINEIKKYGKVITEHVGDYKLSIKGQSSLSDRLIHDRDLKWLRHSDVVVAEVTIPSLGVGYEIATAILWRIPVIVLHRDSDKLVSAMIAGSPGVEIYRYKNIAEFTDIIEKALNKNGLEKLK
ncbi:nucleoside 2-deoxyribosyltransferase [Yersinia mollaretii]|uniref:nucleoside 2-deoxyribosyltransferase n=1 Tax=Yersinia mollaretii TaxID=33060 RepID=UPI0011A1FAE0|nr:nucleoside 2-deoxyribosyltransferase [Yersinia mollaretii]